MASGSVISAPEWVDRLREWRQGDYTLELPQIVLMTDRDEGDFVPDGVEVIGLIVISQTCDIVNWGENKEWVTVASLREVDDSTINNINSGSTPAWATIECSPRNNVVVDLNQMMTVHKSVLAQLERRDGFKTDRERTRFADTLSRKHGRFAFPDNFNEHVLSPLKRRIVKAHKKDSDQGKVYRSIISPRVVASPSWEADKVMVGFRFVIAQEARREATRELITKTVSDHLGKISWPNGFSPEDPPFIIQTMDEMSAQEWIDSQEIDWLFISRSTS